MAGLVACGQPARQGPQEQACGLKWEARAGDVSPEVVRQEGLRLAARLGLHPLVGQVLWSRNLRNPGQALSFLRSDSVPDPWRLEGIPQAAWRIWRAVRRGERVVVYGDYDADGQTAAAIMVRLLRRLGAQVEFFIPHRLSLGYGLHGEVLLEMARAGVKLVVAVDCGLSAAQAVQEAAMAGLEVVVIDHHEPPEKLPEAAAVVAAHQLKGWPGVDQMSAAGLAFHTARAVLDLAGLGPPLHEELVQLAAVGTVADVVALVGENRRLVRLGLEALRRSPLPGLQALASAASLDLSAVESRHVAFVLAPRLNAAGRVDDAVVGLRLLLSEDPHEARQLAARLEQANRARQRTEQEVLEQAAEQVARRLAACDDPVAVAVGEGWHPGVIGIVASRLVERFGRPAVVVSLEDDQARGSARSVEGVDIHRLLSRCRPLLSRFGGHPMAAGFSLPRQHLQAFVEALLDAASHQLPALPAPRLFIDGWAHMADLGELLGRQLPLLEPYGEANPRPVLACLGVQVVEARAVGAEGQHLRLVLREPVSGEQRPAVAFDAAQRWGDGGWLREEGRLWDVAFHVRVGPFNPCELQVVDLRPSSRDLSGRAVVRLRGLRDGDCAAPADPAAAGLPEQTGARAATGNAAAACLPSVDDLRGLAERGVEGLGRWLEQAGPPPGTVVWVAVGDEGEGLRLAWEWWQAGLSRYWPVAWHQPGLPCGDENLLEPARLRVVWQPRALAGHPLGRGAWLVVWDPVPDGPAWARACLQAGVARVVLAFGQQAAQARARRMLDLLPDRQALRGVYRLLAAQAAVAGPELGVLDELHRSLALLAEGDAPAPAALQAALEVFEELGLAHRDRDGRWTWRGAPAGVKLDLAASARYNELIQARAQWMEYLRLAGQPEGLSLWRHWLDGGGVGEPGQPHTGFESPHTGDP